MFLTYNKPRLIRIRFDGQIYLYYAKIQISEDYCFRPNVIQGSKMSMKIAQFEGMKDRMMRFFETKNLLIQCKLQYKYTLTHIRRTLL